MSHVELCSPDEAAAIIKRLRASPSAPFPTFKGWVDAVCREEDGSVAWEVHQPNLVTDLMRRHFVHGDLNGSVAIITSPGIDPPTVGRTCLFDDGATTSAQYSGAIAAVKNTITNTRSWTTTFTAPAANRTVGIVGLQSVASGIYRWYTSYGLSALYAYTVLSPVRVQTTTSTLEVTYRITMTTTY